MLEHHTANGDRVPLDVPRKAKSSSSTSLKYIIRTSYKCCQHMYCYHSQFTETSLRREVRGCQKRGWLKVRKMLAKVLSCNAVNVLSILHDTTEH